MVDVERSSPSRAVAADFVHFAREMYRELEIDRRLRPDCGSMGVLRAGEMGNLGYCF